MKTLCNPDSSSANKHRSGVMLAVGLALMLTLDVATAGVATTRHNLGSTGTAGNNKFSGTTEICVFCHTPHGANVSIPVPAPLWNRNFTTTAYATYASLGTTTLDGEVATTGSVSIACLSCHDGTQAMDIMINTPGSGTDPAGFPATGTWSGTNQTAGKITGAFTNLGVDLTNDHPIGIQYCGGGVKVGTPNGPCINDADFKLAPNLQYSGAGDGTMWWIETNGNTTREITDLPLYTRAVTTAYDGLPLSGDAQPYVECASCHDPHNNNTTFLRVSNNSSVICLACHTK